MTDKDVNTSRFPAVILAGGAADPEMAAKYRVENRAAVPIAGKMMIEYIVDALVASAHVTDVNVVGNIHCKRVTRIIQPGNSLIENLIAGVKACSLDTPDSLVLVATSDIPLITSAAIDDLAERCCNPETDFYYPVISKKTIEKRFPGMRRTYARLAEGTFTGGNVMVMRSGFVMQNADLIREVFAARKSVLRLARVVGLPTLLRAAIAQTVWGGAINFPLLEKTVGRLLNAQVKAVETGFPEIGADVDRIEHIAFAEEALGNTA